MKGLKRIIYIGERGCGKSLRVTYYLYKKCLPWYLRPFYTYRYYLKHHVCFTDSIWEGMDK